MVGYILWGLKESDTTERLTDTHTYPLQRLKFLELTMPIAGEEVEQQKLIHCWWECKVLQPL